MLFVVDMLQKSCMKVAEANIAYSDSIATTPAQSLPAELFDVITSNLYIVFLLASPFIAIIIAIIFFVILESYIKAKLPSNSNIRTTFSVIDIIVIMFAILGLTKRK